MNEIQKRREQFSFVEHVSAVGPMHRTQLAAVASS